MKAERCGIPRRRKAMEVIGPLELLAVLVVSACGGSAAPMPTPSTPVASPAACLTAAAGYEGSVAAAFASSVGAIRDLPAVAKNPQLDSFAPTQEATVCYIDGEIAKGPPLPANGTVPPSFDRAVVVVVGDKQIPVAFGYRRSLPIQAP